MGAPVISRQIQFQMGLPNQTRTIWGFEINGASRYLGDFLWNMGTRNIDKDNYPRNQYPPSYKWRFQFSLGNSVVHICSIAMFDYPRVHPEMIQPNIWSIEVLYHTMAPFWSFWATILGAPQKKGAARRRKPGPLGLLASCPNAPKPEGSGFRLSKNWWLTNGFTNRTMENHHV